MLHPLAVPTYRFREILAPVETNLIPGPIVTLQKIGDYCWKMEPLTECFMPRSTSVHLTKYFPSWVVYNRRV